MSPRLKGRHLNLNAVMGEMTNCYLLFVVA